MAKTIKYNGRDIDIDRCNIYQENGYIDMKDIILKCNTFCKVISGRGGGKTVSSIDALDEISNELNWGKPYCFFMRRTASILDEIMNPLLSPFNDANYTCGTNFIVEKNSKNTYAIKNENEEKAETHMIAGALSTIANIRGFAMPTCKVILYDEAVPEKTQRPIRDEGDALDNAYETINRNRELKGEDAVKFIALANNNGVFTSEIALRWGTVGIIDFMIENNIEQFHDDEHDLSVIMPMHSPISEKKANTALYRRNRNSESNSDDFVNMAIKNMSKFDKSHISNRNTNEYKPMFCANNLYFYKHKSRNEYYVSFHKNGTFNETYDITTTSGLSTIHDKYIFLKYAYLFNELPIFFSSVVANVLFEKIFVIK